MRMCLLDGLPANAVDFSSLLAVSVNEIDFSEYIFLIEPHCPAQLYCDTVYFYILINIFL